MLTRFTELFEVPFLCI